MRYTIALLVVGIAGLLLLDGCSDNDANTQAATHVTIALNWVPEPEFGGIYAARESGAFARHGLSVDIQGGGAGAPVIQRVAAGQVDFGIASADEVIMARSQKADVVALFATYQTCPQGIMVHASRKLQDIGQAFKSGTVAVEPGLPYIMYLRQKYGFEHVKLVPYDGGVARFLADKDFAQQCFVTSEPIAARRQGADPQVFMVADAGYNPYTAVVITRGSYLKTHRATVEAMVQALREGWQTYLSNPQPTNQLMMQLNPSMDAQTFAAAAAAQQPLIQLPKASLGAMTQERWQTLARQLHELGLVDNVRPADEYFVDSEKSLAAR